MLVIELSKEKREREREKEIKKKIEGIHVTKLQSLHNYSLAALLA